MRPKEFLIFIVIELLAILVAGLSFSLLTNKIAAGGIAGLYFVVSGLYLLARANQWPGKWSAPTWYVLFVHVFVVSIPMLMSRFLQLSSSFADVRIFGLPGPVFHQISTGVFSVLIVSTLIDGARGWRAARPPTQN